MNYLVPTGLFILLTSRVFGACGEFDVPPGPTPLVTDPTDRQIVQRNSSGVGVIPIGGTVPGGADRVDIAVFRTSTNQRLLDWTVIGQGAQFQYNLVFGQGGWYRISIRAWRNGAANISDIEHVGVGDIFVVAGQSNGCNTGKTKFNTDDRVSSWNGVGWQLSDDPQPSANLIGTGIGTDGSVWAIAGSQLVSQYDVPIGFVNVCVGETSISQWMPQQNQLYPGLRHALQMLGVDGARAILWDQGETSTGLGTSFRTYRASLLAIINQSRQDSGYPIPCRSYAVVNAR